MSSPQQLDFVTVDVFTTNKYEGNPLAIVRIPDGAIISQEQKQAIAREFNLSETTFLHEKNSSSQDDAWTVDIFLTTTEVPFAGHPTVGTACYALARAAQDRGVEDGILEATFHLKAGPVGLQYDVSKKTARAKIPHNVSVRFRLYYKTQAYGLLVISTKEDGPETSFCRCNRDLQRLTRSLPFRSKTTLLWSPLSRV
jgi:predicted PhzF superfamily epimerase YddE/YHI9